MQTYEFKSDLGMLTVRQHALDPGSYIEFEFEVFETGARYVLKMNGESIAEYHKLFAVNSAIAFTITSEKPKAMELREAGVKLTYEVPIVGTTQEIIFWLPEITYPVGTYASRDVFESTIRMQKREIAKLTAKIAELQLEIKDSAIVPIKQKLVCISFFVRCVSSEEAHDFMAQGGYLRDEYAAFCAANKDMHIHARIGGFIDTVEKTLLFNLHFANRIHHNRFTAAANVNWFVHTCMGTSTLMKSCVTETNHRIFLISTATQRKYKYAILNDTTLPEAGDFENVIEITVSPDSTLNKLGVSGPGFNTIYITQTLCDE